MVRYTLSKNMLMENGGKLSMDMVVKCLLIA